VAFAWGANDVGNSIGPLAVALQTYRTGQVPSSRASVSTGLLVLGATGLVAGLGEGVLHSTAQHSTAQHSTAQHSTAQHSTARTAAVMATGTICLGSLTG
jgi:phosphate/sulfate permease